MYGYVSICKSKVSKEKKKKNNACRKTNSRRNHTTATTTTNARITANSKMSSKLPLIMQQQQYKNSNCDTTNNQQQQDNFPSKSIIFICWAVVLFSFTPSVALHFKIFASILLSSLHLQWPNMPTHTNTNMMWRSRANSLCCLWVFVSV